MSHRNPPALRALFALAAILALACHATIVLARPLGETRTFVDSAGRQVEIPETVSRVLAAGPPASVLLYTLAPEKMVGWISAPAPDAKPFLLPVTRDLPAYGRLTGRGGTANVEAVLNAKPDLIVDVGSTGATYVSLADRVQAQTGIPYILLDGRFDKMPEVYRQLGTLLGADGDALASEAQRMMKEVSDAVASVPEAERPRLYYGRGPKGLETGLSGSITTEILDAAGGRNVAAAAGTGGLATVSPEQILGWNPDIILTVDPDLRKTILADPLWSGVKAVREGKVYSAPSLPFGWFDAPPGVNRLIGLRWLAGLLYPQKFAQPLDQAVRNFYRQFYHVELDQEQLDALIAATGGAGR